MSSPHPRIDWQEFKQLAPAANAAILALGNAAVEAGLEKPLLELVKLRASQINRCAFCLQLHLNVARGLGLPAAQLDLLGVWREAGIFSPREMAALAWTELLTRISEHEIGDADYAAVLQHFTKAELAHLTAAIGAINVWNRICGSFRFAPPIPATPKAGAA
jgi:AhpD family alkylhydroperoxidase